ncbi:C-X-C chemokine receptor type 6-like [Stegostoma tigrinum]|uniref:C-X-C chemokine receptor type 6-like n=1 Tax=Stegostoma tigrinum TaxID=3053191 RepID=UPI00287025C8|nr:C-X-C chemokine receptor type 6-like [Stegostoma tigrinum]XP_048412008.2 C-X-C chemokine receptor type 6-like [Stegostoma tigrinum]
MMTEYEYYDENITFTIPSSVLCEKHKVADFRKVFMPCFYSVIFLSGLLGNSLVVVIYIYYEKLKTVTNIYMMNLAIADLLFLCTLPFWAVDAHSQWIFGTFMCKLVSGAYTVNLYSCMLILTCVSINRYKAIVQATKSLNNGKKIFHSKLICVGIWVFAIILALPEFILCKAKTETDTLNKSVCKMVYPLNQTQMIKVGVRITQMAVGFLIPFVAMTICYSVIAKTLLQANRFQKHKSLKIIFAVIAAFVICELPFNIVLLMQTLQIIRQEQTSCEYTASINYAIIVTESIAYVHCCLNPILYVFLGVKFRNSFLKILKDAGCISQKQLAGLLKTECETSQPVSVVSETTAMYPL